MPTLATSNRSQLRYIAETVFGETPVAGNPNNLRQTGESLAFAIQTATSKEIRSDRQVTDLVQTGATASGGVNFELSYKEFDTLFAAALQGVWGNQVGVSGSATISASFTATTLTASAGTPFVDVVAGQWIKISGAATLANNGYFKVLNKTSSTVLTFAAATFTIEAGPTANVTVSGSQLTNGTTQSSFTLERALGDVNQYFSYRGMVPSKLSMAFSSGSICTGSIDFTGKDSILDAVTRLPGAPIASQTGDVMNAVVGVGNILEGGVALTGTFIKSLKFDLDNKLRGQTAIGTRGSAGIGSGTCEVKGEIEVYLADGTMYNKFINNTTSSISWRVVDGLGNGYVITFPKVKYADAKVQAGGLDQDVMLSMPFTALMDTTTLKTITIDRVGV